MIAWEPRNSFEINTPLGRGRVLVVLMSAHDNEWTVAINDTQAIVTFTQDKLRMSKSYTHGRGISDDQMKTYTGS